jgi:hypothetical protein
MRSNVILSSSDNHPSIDSPYLYCLVIFFTMVVKTAAEYCIIKNKNSEIALIIYFFRPDLNCLILLLNQLFAGILSLSFIIFCLTLLHVYYFPQMSIYVLKTTSVHLSMVLRFPRFPASIFYSLIYYEIYFLSALDGQCHYHFCIN